MFRISDSFFIRKKALSYLVGKMQYTVDEKDLSYLQDLTR